MFNLILIKFDSCDPFSPTKHCFDLASEYEVLVSAYLGSTAYSSNPLNIAVTTSYVAVSNVTAIANASTIETSWSQPSNDSIDVTGYRVWVTYDTAHNGYVSTSPDLLSLPHELRDINNITSRLEVDAIMDSLVLTGCYNDSSSFEEHCISPWTYYRIYVSTLTPNYVGTPVSSTVLTDPVPPYAPVNLASPAQTDSSITLKWQAGLLVSPITEFNVSVTNTITGESNNESFD